MRGRTLDDSFIILDEAQNTSREQMKMFLTRLGFGSKIVITGDVTQIDLPDGKASGLKEAMRVLRDVEGIGICELTNADVVRHVMVQRIVEAYERYETAKKRRKGAEVMAKRHYIPVTADVPGAASQGNCALIRKVIRTALAAEGVDFPCEVDVLLTDDSGIHAINREMRQVDRPTDVLSFPEFDLTPGQLPGAEDADPGTGLVPLGDMVISMERVAAQAREYNHSKRRELSYLVVHSVLHLLGYDHLDEGPQKARMRAREEAILGSWASGGESLPGQAPAGAQAQQEGVDGSEFPGLFVVGGHVGGHVPIQQGEGHFIFLRLRRVQLGADVVEIEPFHKVGHRNHLSKH